MDISNLKINKKILTITAHPDDNLCNAGTVLLLRKAGFEPFEVLLTKGERGVKKKDGTITTSSASRLKKIRLTEFQKAAHFLGLRKTFFMGQKDLQITRSLPLLEKLVSIIREVQPGIIFLLSPDDYHFDHRQASAIGLEACKMAALSWNKKLGAPYRVPIVLYIEGLELIEADLLVDISSVFPEKRKLLSLYESQVSKRAKQLLESFGSARGYLGRSQYAEAFQVPKNFPILVGFKEEK